MRVVPLAMLGLTALISTATIEAQQQVARPAGVRVTQDGWQFTPVVVESQGAISIPGVLALRNKATAVGENIVAIWYENPNSAGQEWSAKAWETPNQWEAIKWTKSTFAISDSYDFLWPTSDAKTTGLVTLPPQGYFKGVLSNDLMASFMTGSNADAIAEFLVAVGYKAASVKVDKNGPCGTSVVLQALADTVAYAVIGTPSKSAVQARYEALVPATCAVAAAPPPPGVIPGTTTPYPGTPLGPMPGRWQRDSRPGVYDPSCSSATTCCYKAPIIFLYTTTNWLGQTIIEYCETDISWSCPTLPDGSCSTTPNCPEPIGPPWPAPGTTTVSCGNSYY